MTSLENILNDLPDKWESKTTTSKKFKSDLYNFCVEHSVKSVLEIGASVGHTTYFLAHFIDKITSVEFNKGKVENSKLRNKKFNNITFVQDSAYGHEWQYGSHEMVIIDCIHDYVHVMSDIENAIKLSPKFLVFDDYGLFPEVKRAIDDSIKLEKITMMRLIGYEPGTHFSMAQDPKVTKDKVLADYEGIICQVLN